MKLLRINLDIRDGTQPNKDVIGVRGYNPEEIVEELKEQEVGLLVAGVKAEEGKIWSEWWYNGTEKVLHLQAGRTYCKRLYKRE